MWIIQKSANQLYIDHTSNFSTTFQSEISAITGMCLSERNLAITNQKNIAIYKIPRPDEFQDRRSNRSLSIKLVHSFVDSDCQQMFIYEENLIVVGHEKVRIFSFGGIVLKEITFNNNEGKWIFPYSTQIMRRSKEKNFSICLFSRKSDRFVDYKSIFNRFHDERIHSGIRHIAA